MNIKERFPDVLQKIVDRFLDKHPGVDPEVFMKILAFSYREGVIKGQKKYLTTLKKQENE